MMENVFRHLKERARRIKADTFALYLALRHPGVPWYAKVWTLFIVGYALSPIDLIPDFIPVLGYLDDVILVPAGMALAVRMIPPAVMAECRAGAQAQMAGGKPRSWTAAGVIILIWLAALMWAGSFIYRIGR